MANQMYDEAKDAIARGEIDFDTNEFRVILIDVADYTFDANLHDFLDDVPAAARVATSDALGAPTISDGLIDFPDELINSVSGDPVEALIIYKHAETVGGGALAENAARLICYIDTDSAASPISFVPNGSGCNVQFPNGTIQL